ncbi:hypothetical protein PC128_g20318 [Phytophthora cactorum]|nr:hypothetical protein PC128_g20318 [Phytophthora cactorum]
MKLYQTFYKRSSMTLADRNKKIKESYVQLGLEAPDLEVLLDENFLIAYCATCLRTLVHRSVVGRANVYVAMFARPGAPPSSLEKTEAEPCMTDVHNILARLKRKVQDEIMLSQRLPAASVRVRCTASHTSTWILMKTSRQSPGALSFGLRT